MYPLALLYKRSWGNLSLFNFFCSTKQIKGTLKKRIETRARLYTPLLEIFKSKERSYFCLNPSAFVFRHFSVVIVSVDFIVSIFLCCCRVLLFL